MSRPMDYFRDAAIQNAVRLNATQERSETDRKLAALRHEIETLRHEVQELREALKALTPG